MKFVQYYNLLVRKLNFKAHRKCADALTFVCKNAIINSPYTNGGCSPLFCVCAKMQWRRQQFLLKVYK